MPDQYPKYIRVHPFNVHKDKVARIGPLLEEGTSVAKIAEELGISRSTVYNIARKLGLLPY